MKKNKYLLILSCSQRKDNSKIFLKAINRYTGVFYKVLKKNNPNLENLDLIIISAKYGFLIPDTLIENYDIKMTNKIALELRDTINLDFNDFFKNHGPYDESCINLSKFYSKATYYCSGIRSNKIIKLKGGIGERMKQLKEWLCKIQEKDGLNPFLKSKKIENEEELLEE